MDWGPAIQVVDHSIPENPGTRSPRSSNHKLVSFLSARMIRRQLVALGITPTARVSGPRSRSVQFQDLLYV
jgi:hypothetical protein